MTATQLSLAQQIEALKQQYQAIVASGAGNYTQGQINAMNNLHAQAVALTDQLQAAGWSGPNPEGQDAASWAATIAGAQASGTGSATATGGGSGGSTTSGGSSAVSGTGGATVSNLGGAIGNFLNGIGKGINTFTGSTGQTRAAQWFNILLIPIIVIAGAGFLMHSYWHGPARSGR